MLPMAWASAVYPARQAQRQNMTLAAWAAAQGLLPPAGWQAAATVPGLAAMSQAQAAAAALAAAAPHAAAAPQADPDGGG